VGGFAVPAGITPYQGHIAGWRRDYSRRTGALATLALASTAKQAKGWDTLPELFSAVTPSSDAERALVVAYWMQQVQGEPDFDGFSVNKS